MAERPILFNASMVRAILAGTKTQTRRVVKLTSNGHVKEPRGHRRWHPADPDGALACPHGQDGDRLWVRERLSYDTELGHYYEATALGTLGNPSGRTYVDYDEETPANGLPARSIPSIHMRRWASRITLEVTGVGIQRLQDLSEEDAQAEGIEKTKHGFWSTYGQADFDGTYSPIASYRCLWASINGADSWAANPWVWVVEFKRLEKPT